MKTSKGMVQGYNGVAMVDDKHQVIVGAEAFGKGPEQDLLKPMIDVTKENLEDDVFEKAKLTADSGFHTKDNMNMLAQEGIDAYVADGRFRKRDPRFDNSGRYKEEYKKELLRKGKPGFRFLMNGTDFFKIGWRNHRWGMLKISSNLQICKLFRKKSI